MMPATARNPRAHGPFKLDQSYGQVGARAWLPRMPTPLCGPVAR